MPKPIDPVVLRKAKSLHMNIDGQKFKRGDIVQLADDIPWITSGRGKVIAYRYNSGKQGVVMGSYADEYGGDNHNEYTIWFPEGGACSWYEEKWMTLLKG